MKGLRRGILVLSCLFLAAVTASGAARAQTLKDQLGSTGPGPLVIHSKQLELDDAAGTVIFKGEVSAKKDEFEMTCQRMTVHYEKSDQGGAAAKGGTPGEARTQIQKIVASGKVHIQRAQGGEATADQAVYYDQEEKIVLTGKPVVKQGEDFVEGDRITILLKENRSIVESSGDSKVKAVIHRAVERGKP